MLTAHGDVRESTIELLGAWRPPDRDQVVIRDAAVRLLSADRRSAYRGTWPHLVASVIVIRRDEHVLLAQYPSEHPLASVWLEIGGHLELGDADMAAAALREASEETGLRAISLVPNPVDLELFPDECPPGKPNRHIAVRFAAMATDQATTASSELSRLDWFPPDELPTPIGLGVRRLVARALAAVRQQPSNP